ncbi:MAG TPA: hypothetical protein PL063_05650 [Candidatus Cloacimonadota bacterium]|jgi:hypothetical protein|nr:hypothetical protein [Candidatus Cloacimonadales bacterium]HPY96677.1 hypothetical protein [Candidatus Cloacimonadota bacterium]HQB41290.1 hypothetical protein [Candidatus Cloacimonadota bacterium]
MFSLLLQKKNVILIKENSSKAMVAQNVIPTMIFPYKDPIEHQINQLCKHDHVNCTQGDLNIQRIFIKGLANSPELFNNVCVKR